MFSIYNVRYILQKTRLKIKVELEEKIKSGSNNIEDFFLLGGQYLHNGDYDLLLSLYDKLLKFPLSPIDKSRVYYERGEAFNLSNNRKEANLSYERSYQLLEGLGDCIEVLDLKGLNKYNLSLLSSDDNIEYLYAKEAIEIFLQLIGDYELGEKFLMTYSYLADLYFRQCDYDNALHYYTLALAENEDNQDIWILSGIASVYGKMKEIDQSIHYFNKAISMDGSGTSISKIYFDMGIMYFEANMFSDSYGAFQNALKRKYYDPILKNNIDYEVEILWHLGSIDYELDSCSNAIAHLEKVIDKINFDHHYYANSHLTLGHCFLYIGNNSQAIEHYNNVLVAVNATNDEKSLAKDCLKTFHLIPNN